MHKYIIIVFGLCLLGLSSSIVLSSATDQTTHPEIIYETRLIFQEDEEENIEEPINEFPSFWIIFMYMLKVVATILLLFVPYLFVFGRVFTGFFLKARLLDYPKFLFGTYLSWLVFFFTLFIIRQVMYPIPLNSFFFPLDAWIYGAGISPTRLLIMRAVYVIIETGVFFLMFKKHESLKSYMIKALPIYLVFYLILWFIL